MPLFGKKKKVKDSDKASHDQSNGNRKSEKRDRPIISNPLVDTSTQSDFPPLRSTSSLYTMANGPSDAVDACDPGYSVITHYRSQEDNCNSTGKDTKVANDLVHEGLPSAPKASRRASPGTARAESAETGTAQLEIEGDLNTLPSLTSLQAGSDDSFLLNTPPHLPHDGSPVSSKQKATETERVYSQVRKKTKSSNHLVKPFAAGGPRKHRASQLDDELEYRRRRAKNGRVSPENTGVDTTRDARNRVDKKEQRTSRKEKTFRNKSFPNDHYDESQDSEEGEIDGNDLSEEDDLTLSSMSSHNEECEEHNTPHSASYPVHRPPSSGKRKTGGTSPSFVPVIQPETITPSSPLSPYAPCDAGYVFTKRQPDGSLHYYSATPVVSPTSSIAAAPSVLPLRKPAADSISEYEMFYYPPPSAPPKLSSSWPYLYFPSQNALPAGGQPLAVTMTTHRAPGPTTYPLPLFCAPNVPSASSPLPPWSLPVSHPQPSRMPSSQPPQQPITCTVPTASPSGPRNVSSPPRPTPRKAKEPLAGGKDERTSSQPSQHLTFTPQPRGAGEQREGQPQGAGEQGEGQCVGTAVQTASNTNAAMSHCSQVLQEGPGYLVGGSKSPGRDIEGKLKYLEEEGRSLKETVVRLTDELTRQSFKPTVPIAPQSDGTSIDGKLIAKDVTIANLKEDILQLKSEVAKLVEENHVLTANVQSLEGISATNGEWKELAERAEQVTAENASLQRQHELQRQRLEEMKKEHLATVSQLNMELSRSKKDKEAIGKDLSSLKEAHLQLQEKLNHVVAKSTACVPMEEHKEALEEFQRLLDGLSEKSQADSRTQDHQLKALQKEKKSLVTKLTDTKAVILQLEEECTSLHKSNRKAQEKIAELQRELEESRDREVATHMHLNSVVMQAEKALAERDTFAHIVRYQQKCGRGDEDKPSSSIGHDAVRVKRKLQMWNSSDRTERITSHEYDKHPEGSYHGDLQYLRSLLQQNRSDLAACVGNVKLTGYHSTCRPNRSTKPITVHVHHHIR